MSYRLFTLGSIRILGDDGSEVRLRSTKHTALFVYLNATGRRVLLRSELCDLLWTTEKSRARHSLSQALYDIRSRVGPVIDTEGGEAVSLAAPGAWFDADAFEDRLSSGEPGRACELYGGPFAVELDRVGTEGFEFWLESERSRLETVGRNAFRRHIAALEEEGRWHRLAEVARTFLKRAPDDLRAHRSFVRSLWLGGDRTSALDHQRDLEERRPDLAERLRPLIERIEGGRPDRVRERSEPRAPSLVGRGDELRRLRRLSSSPEEPVVAHVRGEAGIGKTRLVDELRTVLELDGWTAIASRCWEAESSVPYSAVAEGLEPWLGASGPPHLPGGEGHRAALARAALYADGGAPPDLSTDREALEELRRRVFEEVTMAVRDLAGDGPTLWVVEDVQWIDETSAALLHYLLRRLTDVPLLLVLTSRPAVDREGGLSGLLERTTGVEELTLGPLDEESALELLRRASDGTHPSDVLVRVAGLSGGNPYFALELLRAVQDRGAPEPGEPSGLPGRELVDGRLGAILRERLRGISAEGLRVLEAVAVLGGRTPWDVVLEVARVDVDDPSRICLRLGRRGLLRTEDGDVEFVHDIVRELVYADLGDIRRYALHRMAAEALARTGGASRGVLADHFRRGGDGRRAFHYAVAAARDAESRGAHREAARYAEVALDALPADRRDAEVEMRRVRARARSCVGAFTDAARTLEPLLDGPPDDRSPAEVRALLELAEVQIESADADGARRSLREARGGVEASLSGPEEEALAAVCLSLELRRAIYYGERRSIEAAGRRLEGAFGPRRAVDDNDWARAGMVLAAYLAFYRSAEEAKELIQRVMDGEIPTRTAMRATGVLGTLELRCCRWDRAEHQFREGVRLARRRNDVAAEAAFLNNLGCLLMEWGRWAEAGESLDEALDLSRRGERCVHRSIPPLLNLGNTALYQLRTSRARSRFTGVVEAAADREMRKFEAEGRACLGLLDLLRGDGPAADRQYRALLDLAGDGSLSQEGFKVDWFSAFRGGAGPVAEVLRRRAGAYRTTDLLSHLKLLWLSEVSREDREPDGEVRERLRAHGLLWFEKFAERWMSATRVNRAAS